MLTAGGTVKVKAHILSSNGLNKEINVEKVCVLIVNLKCFDSQ